MIEKAKVLKLAAEAIEDTDLYVLGLSISGKNDIKLELEGTGSVTIEDCVNVSRAIEHNLDREEEDFSLQVTTPGVDQPLRDPRQYVKNIGRRVKVRTRDDRVIEGPMVHADESTCTVHFRRKEVIEGTRKKEWVETDEVIPYDQIQETKVQISFK